MVTLPARQVYIYSTLHTQWSFKVLYIKGNEIVIKKKKITTIKTKTIKTKIDLKLI